MITVQAEVSFRVEREADAHRILLALADLVMPERDGAVGATIHPETEPTEPWQHPHMEAATGSGPCPICGREVAQVLLLGHLELHRRRGESE